MSDIVIVGAKRTPIGKFGGVLKDLSAVELGTIAARGALQESNISNEAIQHVIFGNVLQANNGQNPARQISIHSQIPHTTPAMTINEVCGSGLKAIILGIQSLKLGDAQAVLVGGTESMSNAPYYLTKERFGARYGHQTVTDSILQDGLTDAFHHIHMGITAEHVAEHFSISRQEQDEFALHSHQKAAQAKAFHARDIEPITLYTKKGHTTITEDEGIREHLTIEQLSALKPAFKENGSVSAGNASSLNDGAAALVLTTRSFAQKHHLPILASIIDYAEAGNDPKYMGFAPYYAIEQLCKKTGLTLEQFDSIESNEAFAAQSLALAHELNFDMTKVNQFGGAISLGHPIGASGARIVVTLLNTLKQTKGHYGLATLCVGGGIGLALALKNEQ
ncbi:thiolase family protein [Granulicatella sp. 19428wC4_WM01]|uniref:thiolase family protein n=2 Tax=unclassified Granulicatella TaxID=2630493 RepID=UPI0010733C82|nr:thiolase family protein [Granulicatella sp. WM01]MBF0780495.1 thiolase family protein [Granulicatella sp. 19428wC4_WM01]TFU95359.1 thiolase family protein [Granulicatella sp. WM01]